MQVEVRDNIEGAIRDFKRKVERDGVLRELKTRQFFLSRSERRRVKDRESLSRARKMERRRWREEGGEKKVEQ